MATWSLLELDKEKAARLDADHIILSCADKPRKIWVLTQYPYSMIGIQFYYNPLPIWYTEYENGTYVRHWPYTEEEIGALIDLSECNDL